MELLRCEEVCAVSAADACTCGHSINLRCEAIRLVLYGELTAIVCNTASSGNNVCSIAPTTRCPNGELTMWWTSDLCSETHCEPWKTSGSL